MVIGFVVRGSSCCFCLRFYSWHRHGFAVCTSLLPSPPHPPTHPTNSRPEITRCDERWSTGVASYSQEDVPETTSPDPPQPASLRVNLDRATRSGRCPKHECKHALRPHIFRSGKTPGKLVLLCSRWFNVTQGKRDCWGQVDFPMSKFGDLPAFLKREYGSIRQALGRGSHV